MKTYRRKVECHSTDELADLFEFEAKRDGMSKAHTALFIAGGILEAAKNKHFSDEEWRELALAHQAGAICAECHDLCARRINFPFQGKIANPQPPEGVGASQQRRGDDGGSDAEDGTDCDG